MEVVADMQSRIFSDAAPEIAFTTRNGSNIATPVDAPEYVVPATTSTTNTTGLSQIPTMIMASAPSLSPTQASLTAEMADATADVGTRIESTNPTGGNVLDFAVAFTTSKQSAGSIEPSTKNENATNKSERAGTGTDENTGKGDEKDSNMDKKSHRKALPTPTKSEIVIRNRLSAQRSNERRKKKIEETRTQLNYLKLTYLPHLEKLQAMLKAENEQLKLKFMEKYMATDISSFY